MHALETIGLYQLFLELTHNADKAIEFVHKIEEVIGQKFREKEKELATKEDVQTLKTAISEANIAISESKVELIKWFIGVAIAVVGLTVSVIALL